jgi:hypothetical protein
MTYSISIILPFLNEIVSLKKTLLILDKIKIKKEFIIIYSNNITSKQSKNELLKLKKKNRKIKSYPQKKPFVGGAIDLGVKKSRLNFITIMASDLETNPNELKKMIEISIKNPKSIISADRWMNSKGFSDYGIIKFLANFFFQKLIKIFLIIKF